jgi:hypothetical protein
MERRRHRLPNLPRELLYQPCWFVAEKDPHSLRRSVLRLFIGLL